jgi:hypothetical protein
VGICGTCGTDTAELPYGWDEAVDDYIGVYYIEYASLPLCSSTVAQSAPNRH